MATWRVYFEDGTKQEVEADGFDGHGGMFRTDGKTVAFVNPDKVRLVKRVEVKNVDVTEQELAKRQSVC